MKALLSVLLVLLAAVPLAAEPTVSVVAAGLEVPWALAFAPDGALYLTERPGRLRLVRAGRLEPAPLVTLPVAAVGEGGLMGLALDPDFAHTRRLYTCYTAERNGRLINRIVTLRRGDNGALGEQRVLLDDLPGGTFHDGCRLKFGPDGKLYATTGDAGEGRLAQRRESLAGKILRFNPDGSIPGDNPFPGSPVYSLGHRNAQGLDWDAKGRLIASEHGPSGFPGGHDEINLIQPGANYGWPEVAGKGGQGRFVDPLVESGRDTWAPSGLAIHDGYIYVAALRGRRLLRMRLTTDGVGEVTALLVGTHGRLRDVVVGPDGALYVTTSNRDGRGSASAGDDRVLRVVP
jgi:glucose/arabinose dehydrogenase